MQGPGYPYSIYDMIMQYTEIYGPLPMKCGVISKLSRLNVSRTGQTVKAGYI